MLYCIDSSQEPLSKGWRFEKPFNEIGAVFRLIIQNQFFVSPNIIGPDSVVSHLSVPLQLDLMVIRGFVVYTVDSHLLD